MATTTTLLTKPLPLFGTPAAPAAALPIPRLIYGTAWKEDRTATLVHQALRAGFRAVDTAAQPKHYREELVADGIRAALADATLPGRRHLFIQTKFTPTIGKEWSDMPYDRDADIETQVRQSVDSSLRRFDFSATEKKGAGGGDPADGESYLDCLVLHTPMPTVAQTLQVWSVLEGYVPHRIHHLGISNTTLPHLAALLSPSTRVKPSVVQNRLCRRGKHPGAPYEPELYAFCRANRIVFQSFWTLTANPHLVGADCTRTVAEGAGVSNEVALYSLILGVEGWTVLDGTTNEGRMAGDLEGVEHVEEWAGGEGKAIWEACLQELKGILGVE